MRNARRVVRVSSQVARPFTSLSRPALSVPSILPSFVRGATFVSRSFSTDSKNIIAFNLPDIGEGIAEVEVLQIFVKPGDKVVQFDKLMEVQSDKATVDISSRYDGVIEKIHYSVGDMAKTGKPLFDIRLHGDASAVEESEKSAPKAAPASSSPSPVQSGSPVAPSSGKAKGLAAPAVRHIAKQHNISIDSIPATGKDGRVTKDDILRFINGGIPSATSNVTASTSAPSSSKSFEDVVVPIRGIQRAMVKGMTQAWEVPHFGYCDEVVMDNLMNLRVVLKGLAEREGLKFTYMPLILKAASLALSKFPQINGQLSSDGQSLIHKGSHNIGVAMDTPKGLIVPSIKNVQNLSLFEIAKELSRLQALASEGRLGEAELSGTTFSISNIGTIGGTYTAPVIPVPNVAIGAIGKIQKTPRYKSTLPGYTGSKGGDDSLVAAHIMTVTWSADHRVIDGATMARFSNEWKSFLEQPLNMLAYLK